MYLNCHSYHSLLYGTFSIERLVEKAASSGIRSLALTDINNTAGIAVFFRVCQERRIKPVAGIEFRRGDKLLFIGLAKNPEGFSELNRFQTLINCGERELQDRAPVFQQVFVIYPLENLPGTLRENERAGYRPSQAGKLLRTKIPEDKIVVLQPVTFENQADYYLHKNLRAIAHNTLIDKVTPEMTAAGDETFVTPQEIEKALFRFPKVLENSQKLLEQCALHFNFPKNKETFTGSHEKDHILLEKLARTGLHFRYGKNNATAARRLENELKVIEKLGFSAYFLITHDIVTFARQQGIYHVGRGSGANSIVAYCLQITDVDPIELNLYFERFINPKRSSPPDFDLDFSWKEREKIQRYLFRRYGEERVALLGTQVTFKLRSALRELGKVHGLPKEEIDRLTTHPEREAATGTLQNHIYELARRITGFPHERSIHAGGILISEKPLSYFTALDLPPKGLPTTQWDMYTAEMLGFEKLDILSQRGIGHIQEAVEIIAENTGIQTDIHQTEKIKQDKKARALLHNGETIGCFYIESPAMRSLLKNLHCDDYLTLVAASSIIRPGVARSGMMRQYIERFHHPDNFRHLHPVLQEQLHETYGIMVYQEDVLKVCHHYAGLDLADADILRRAMSGKYRGKEEFRRIRDKFFENSQKKGRPEKITQEVWRQIESFAGYSFSKAHSASYAVESFQSLYLKARYPLEFMVAVINNFGGFYATWVYFNEVRRLGGKVHLPCVNHSSEKTSLQEKDIFIGFVHLASLEHKTIKKILSERKNNGLFQDLADFVGRVRPATEQLVLLIRSGAFRFTGKNKPALLWEAHLLLKTEKHREREDSLFDTGTPRFQLPALVSGPLEDAYDELELLGFPVSMSFFAMLKTKFRGEIKARTMASHTGKNARMLGLLVTVKKIRTKRGQLMFMATFMDDRGEMFDTVHFPSTVKKYPFRGKGIYLLLGKVVSEFGYASLEVEKMAKMPLQPDPRGT